MTALRIDPARVARGRWFVLALVGAIWLAAPWLGVNAYWTIQLGLIAIIALIVSGLNLSYGYAGELSLGQVAMFAFGAYIAGYMALHGANDVLLTVACGALGACLLGLASGIPGLRLGGWSLAMVSFFLVLLIPDLVSIFSGQTGGYTGMYGIPAPELFGIALSNRSFYAVTILLTALWITFMRNLVLSRHGHALQVLRESPVLAASVGISVYRLKLMAYAVGAVPAGVAGALFAYTERFISADSFSFSFSIAIIAASILGGPESIYGGIVGAALLEIGPLQAGSFKDYSLLVYGVFLVVGGVLLRGGVAGVGRRLLARAVPAAPAQSQAESAVPREPIHPGYQLGPTVTVSEVTMLFGGLRALDAVSFQAQGGQITAIIGANGSGKTTLLNLISGFLRPGQGVIKLGDRRIDGLRPHRIARLGVSRTFQTPLVPKSMTTCDVVGVARYMRPHVGVVRSVLRTPAFRRIRAADTAESLGALGMVQLRSQAFTEATQLPLGRRRLAELARALVMRPGVILLDEPASGLETGEVHDLLQVVTWMRDAGITVILVEHNFRFVMEVADSVLVLDHGQVLASGPPAEVENDPDVIASYLGGQTRRHRGSSKPAEPDAMGDLSPR